MFNSASRGTILYFLMIIWMPWPRSRVSKSNPNVKLEINYTGLVNVIKLWLINSLYHLLMWKNKGGIKGGIKERCSLKTFFSCKKGEFIEDLQYLQLNLLSKT